MATSVTYTLHEGKPTTLRELALRGLRQLTEVGRYIRDDADVPRVFEPAPYYKSCLEECQARLAKWTMMPLAETKRVYDTEKELAKKEHEESRANNVSERSRYDAMLERIKNWRVQENLEGFKKELISQVEDTKAYHCGMATQPFEWPDFDTWWEDRLRWLREDIERYEHLWNKEVETKKRMTEFVAAFFSSLPDENAPDDPPIK